MQIRLNKFIANNSIYSRRKADNLISEGRVQINSETVTNHGVSIDSEKDKIKIDGNEITPQETKKFYFLLHKPAGYICTRNDELNRKTVMELVPPIKNLKPAGRLDKDSEGILILTNDGEFINKITHPSFNQEKEYFVKIDKSLKKEDQKKIEKGLLLEGKKTAPARIKILNLKDKETTLSIILTEGRNRQIRKSFASLGYTVKYLQRIRIQKITIGNLAKGAYRHLTVKEINDKYAS